MEERGPKRSGIPLKWKDRTMEGSDAEDLLRRSTVSLLQRRFLGRSSGRRSRVRASRRMHGEHLVRRLWTSAFFLLFYSCFFFFLSPLFFFFFFSFFFFFLLSSPVCKGNLIRVDESATCKQHLEMPKNDSLCDSHGP